MKRIILLSMLALMVFGVGMTMAQPKTRVAVMPFTEDYEEVWWVRGRLGTKAATMVTDELINTKKFTVIERRELDKILSEHNLSASGGTSTETAVKLGKLLGVEYMMLGSVREFGWDKYGGSIPGSSRLLGGSRGELYNYNSQISVRMVNVETGEIVFSAVGKGSHRAFAVGIRGYDASAESSYDSIAGETFGPAVQQIIESIKSESASLSTYQGFGRVADVDGKDIYINRGSDDGVRVGDVFTISRLGKEIKDPDTGKVMSRRKSVAGKIKVVSVEGPHMAICVLIEGEAVAKDMIEK